MTIITKPFSEKKGVTLEEPLVENDTLASSEQNDDLESQNHNTVILKARARRLSATTTLCLLLTSLIVVGIGICGGYLLYDQYISTQMRRFRGYSQLPTAERQNAKYDSNDLMTDSDFVRAFHSNQINNNDNDDGDDEFDNNENGNINKVLKAKNNDFDMLLHRYFREKIEIDVDRENFEKIDVPDFRDGRSGRFIHDFNTNTTGIIDITGNRCFVMPLNRGNVLPPKSLYDLVYKMWDGYYKVDTRIVRETMRVVTPPITDLKNIGAYIAKECEGRPVYKLEKFVGGVVKRSTDAHKEIKFSEFSGKGIIEFNIINFDEVQEYEQNH